MKRRERFMHLLALISVSLSIVLLTSYLPANGAFAATLGEILDQARTKVLAGQDLPQVISQSVAAAQESGIVLDALAAPLVETLLEAGIDKGGNGVALAGDIASGLFLAIKDAGVDDPTLFRSVSQAIQGLRAGAARRGLDASQVRAEIQSSLEGAASTTEMAQQMGRIVESTYEEAYAATYTPPAPSPPAAPPSPPGVIGNAYDPTASAY
jgi:hypothetical protein